MAVASTAFMLSSCAYYLEVKGITYQSIRMEAITEPETDINSAQIIVFYDVDINGNIDVTVQNNTNEIMTIDRTKSFFRGSDGSSMCYYDPTINVIAQSTTTGHTTGASVNLGSVARAVGVGGVAGTLLSGVTVGGANQNATTTTNTTYIVDQPKISIAPHAKASMNHVFMMQSFGIDWMANKAQNQPYDANLNFSPDNCPNSHSCSITVSYSIDGEQTYDIVETTLYNNSWITSSVKQTGQVNEALRNVYMAKDDLFQEDWYTLCFGGAPWINRSKKNTCVKEENYNGFKCNHKLFFNYK